MLPPPPTTHRYATIFPSTTALPIYRHAKSPPFTVSLVRCRHTWRDKKQLLLPLAQLRILRNVPCILTHTKCTLGERKTQMWGVDKLPPIKCILLFPQIGRAHV